jgi:methenyltetrahydrofolate cyclohydrolase
MITDPGRFGDLTLDAFTRALASAEPVPGGGSASAVAATLAASLVAMVVRLSQDRPRYAVHAASHARVLAEADASRERLLDLADADARAYMAFSSARRLPRDTASDLAAREAAVRAAARHAANVPLAIVRECHRVVSQVDDLVGRSNVNASSDLDVAALLAQAAARGAGANVLVNLPSVADAQVADVLLNEVETRLHAIEATVARVHEDIRSGTTRPPRAS